MWQRKRLSHLRAFYVACGSFQEEFPLAPGRSGPELAACLFQLERFVDGHEEFATGYHELAPFEFADEPHLLPSEKFPELVPYRSLDASRLKLVGKGKWPMEKFLDGVLWLPFVEPRFLLHGHEIDYDNVPITLMQSPSRRTWSWSNYGMPKVW